MNKFIQNALLVIGGLIISLILAEITLRVTGYSSPFFFMADEYLGDTHLPGAEGQYKKEGESYVRINSDGLRDIEHSINKPSNTFRIAILGDSYAEGFQVDIDKLFWKKLEGHLQQCSSKFINKNIEVINFGTSGYGTARELLVLRKKVFRYQPDLVLLAFTTGNDIWDNNKSLKRRIDYVPYFTIDDNGSLILDKSYLNSTEYKRRNNLISKFILLVGNHIRLVQLARDVRNALKMNKLNIPENDATRKDGLDNRIYLPPNRNAWKDAWSVTEKILLQVKHEVAENDADFLLVTLSNGIQVHPDLQKRSDFMRRYGVNDLYYADKRIRDFSYRHNIDFVMLAPILAEIAEKNKIYLHGFEDTVMGVGHWNEEGHHYAAEIISEHLCNN